MSCPCSILESLPAIEKTGIEFMDHLLSMIYIMIHTYKDKHMVHDRYVNATNIKSKVISIIQCTANRDKDNNSDAGMLSVQLFKCTNVFLGTVVVFRTRKSSR